MLADAAGVTDAGRKRRRNEDSFVLEPPLFAVADGMGGAQAGEVASWLAAAAFREFHDADHLAPEERVAAIIQEANRRIFERARSDSQASGMGTTITAAILEGDLVAVGHVGDSRAYLVRDGQLEQLTQDHSLVADLMRSGRLTPEEAETHPQRSVITRALGTDADVDVDTFTLEAAPGDVVLLCSDGLTTMVGDEEILSILSAERGLEGAGRALVKAANRGGGEDNITVVLFRVEEAEPPASGNGREGLSERSLEDTLSGLEVGAAETGWGAEPEPPPARRRRRPAWRRPLLLSLAGLAFLLVLLAASFWALSQANFVGADEDGNVAIYQGVPWELGGGVELYRPRYVSRVRAIQLSPEERARLFDHSLLGYGEARERVRRYEEEGVPRLPAAGR